MDAVLFRKIKSGKYDADDPIWEGISGPAKDLVVRMPSNVWGTAHEQSQQLTKVHAATGQPAGGGTQQATDGGAGAGTRLAAGDADRVHC